MAVKKNHMGTFRNDLTTLKKVVPRVTEEKPIEIEKSVEEIGKETEVPKGGIEKAPVNEVAQERKPVENEVKRETEKAKRNENPKTQKKNPRRTDAPKEEKRQVPEGKTKISGNQIYEDRTKGVYFRADEECNEKFKKCVRTFRGSANQYFVVLLQKEKKEYEKNPSKYMETMTKRIEERAKTQGALIKPYHFRTDEESFQFVDDVCFEIYCEKTLYLKSVIDKEYDRIVKKEQ